MRCNLWPQFLHGKRKKREKRDSKMKVCSRKRVFRSIKCSVIVYIMLIRAKNSLKYRRKRYQEAKNSGHIVQCTIQ